MTVLSPGNPGSACGPNSGRLLVRSPRRGFVWAPQTVRAFRIPALVSRECTVEVVSTQALARWKRYLDVVDGVLYCAHFEGTRRRKGQPANQRYVALLARLGSTPASALVLACGDVIVTGATQDGEARDVRGTFLMAAWRAGLLPPAERPVGRSR